MCTKVILTELDSICRGLIILFALLSSAAFAEFKKIEIIESERAPNRLYTLDNSRQFNTIKYQAHRMKGDSNKVELLDFEFYALTEPEFNFIKQTYGGSRSQLKYTPGKRYLLSDFLPPFASALVHKRFIPEQDYSLRSVRMVSTNCFGTAYEFMRQSDRTFLTYSIPSGDAFVRVLLENGGTRESHKDVLIDPNKYIGQFGDILVYLTPDGSDGHAAIYIDQGIWFEKMSPSESDAYRLNGRLGIGFDPSLSTTLIRLHSADALPPPEISFGGLAAWPFQIEIAPNGSAHLDPSSFKPKQLR